VKFRNSARMLSKSLLGALLCSLVLMMAFSACKKKAVDPFPASNVVAGWEKTGETRVFAGKDLWQYVDGDAEQYVSAGVVNTSTADYKYKGQLEAVVDVFTMSNAAGAGKVMGTSQSQDSKPLQLGDAGSALSQSVVFRKGPYYVRIVAYEATPDGPQALLALAQSVVAKL